MSAGEIGAVVFLAGMIVLILRGIRGNPRSVSSNAYGGGFSPSGGEGDSGGD